LRKKDALFIFKHASTPAPRYQRIRGAFSARALVDPDQKLLLALCAGTVALFLLSS
jgi:hypothetical protein